MKTQSVLATHFSNPIMAPAQSLTLLVFMPAQQVDRYHWASLIVFTNELQDRVGDSVRVLRIDAATQPQVVRSFDITHMPAFMLVQDGIELWREVGAPDEAMLDLLSNRLLIH